MGQETSKCRRPPGDQWQRARPVNKLVLLQQQELPQHHVGLVEALLVGVNGGRPREWHGRSWPGEILVVPRGEGGTEVLVVILTAAPWAVVRAGDVSRQTVDQQIIPDSNVDLGKLTVESFLAR